MEIGESNVIIRPELAAPEVDEYDSITKNILPEDIEIGKYVDYML
jgi:hypothetical protein